MKTLHMNRATGQDTTTFVRQVRMSPAPIAQQNGLRGVRATLTWGTLWSILACCLVLGTLAGPAYSQSVGSRSLQNITQTPTAATGWSESIWSCGKDHIYWRNVTYNVTGTVTNNTVSYADWWDKFWDRSGTITGFNDYSFNPGNHHGDGASPLGADRGATRRRDFPGSIDIQLRIRRRWTIPGTTSSRRAGKSRFRRSRPVRLPQATSPLWGAVTFRQRTRSAASWRIART